MNSNHDDHGRFAAGGGGSSAGKAGVQSPGVRHAGAAAKVAGHHESVPPRGRMTYPGGNTKPVSAPGPAKSGLSLNAPRGSAWGGAKGFEDFSLRPIHMNPPVGSGRR